MDFVDKNLLGRAVGTMLERATALVYIDAKSLEHTDDPISLSFEFADGVVLRMYGHSDGERLRVDASTREPFDMHELGQVVRRDLSSSPKLKGLIGRTLSVVGAVVGADNASVAGDILGIRFEFDPPERLYVLNWGDTTFFGRDLPADVNPRELKEVPI